MFLFTLLSSILKEHMGKAQKQLGFTIVELLIVIVIIGILAAITIVAYNGIQNRAHNSKRAADLNNVSKALEVIYATDNQYPLLVSTGVGGTNTCLSTPGWNCWGYTDATRFIPSSYLGTMPQDPAFFDSQACNYPNGFGTRAYYYAVKADRQGYILGAYMPNLSTNDANYIAPAARGCGSFMNWAIQKNWP